MQDSTNRPSPPDAAAGRARRAALMTIATAQCGVVSRDQAIQLGYSESAVAHMVTSGRWQWTLPQVMRLAGAERTFVDLGAVVSPLAVERAYDHAVRSGIVRHADVLATWRTLARRGRRGCGVLRRILEARDPGSAPPGSAFEAKMLALVRSGGLPDPVLQHEISGSGWLSFVDLAWPAQRVAVECDGLAHHFGRQRLQWDDTRQNRLVLLGWTVLRFTWQDVADRPDLVLTQIRDALATATS